jgi:hypothetical protein
VAMERVMTEARKLAGEQDFDPAVVRRWLREGDDEERVTALAMMQARPEWRDAESMLIAIGRSRTPFEQYHALRLADEMVADLSPADKQRLAGEIKRVRRGRLRLDADRRHLSERILRKAGQPSDTGS